MLFSSFHFGGLHCALVSGSPLGIGFLLVGPLNESSCHWQPYLSFPTRHPLISLPFGIFGCTNLRRGCPSFHGKKGMKAQRGDGWKKIRS
jgi:hypothetical protein